MANALTRFTGEIHITSKGERRLKPFVVRSVSEYEKGYHVVCDIVAARVDMTDFTFGFSIPFETDIHPSPGQIGIVGIDGINDAGFIFFEGCVIKNNNDEDYERQHREFIEENNRRKRETLDKNRGAWEAIESYLSDQSRARIQYFRENSEEDFELEAWGYELTIGQLTDMLVESNLEQTPEIEASAAYQSCSGNQYGMAKALADAILRGRDIAGTIGGLSPLTGKAYY